MRQQTRRKKKELVLLELGQVQTFSASFGRGWRVSHQSMKNWGLCRIKQVIAYCPSVLARATCSHMPSCHSAIHSCNETSNSRL